MSVRVCCFDCLELLSPLLRFFIVGHHHSSVTYLTAVSFDATIFLVLFDATIFFVLHSIKYCVYTLRTFSTNAMHDIVNILVQQHYPNYSKQMLTYFNNLVVQPIQKVLNATPLVQKNAHSNVGYQYFSMSSNGN